MRCDCGEEISADRLEATKSIGGTTCCTACEEKAEKQEMVRNGGHRTLRPLVLQRVLSAISS